ncbi:hypothetical protein F4805DRAFT_460100 [Annulohypoxylon moriforme]|nr:hypothetical protein F4805DRAFT_460100 [Annulohypoxylon moriforme]
MTSPKKDNTVPGEKISQDEDSGDHDDGKSLELWRPDKSDLLFERLNIGGVGYNKKYSPNMRLALTRAAEKEPPGKFRLELMQNGPDITFRARGHEQAIQHAVQASMFDTGYPYPRLVMYSDGSIRYCRKKHTKFLGLGIAYKQFNFTSVGVANYNGWIDASYIVTGFKDIEAIEILAIHRSLWLAYYAISRYNQRNQEPRSGYGILPSVDIFSDSIGAVNYMKQSYHNESFKITRRPRGSGTKELPDGFSYEAYLSIERLVSLGAKVRIHWMPGHSGIAGNVRADTLANLGAIASEDLEEELNSRKGLIPVQYPIPETGPKILSQIHLGNPVVDLVYWQKKETKEMFEYMMTSKLVRLPRKIQHGLLRVIRGDPSNIIEQSVTGKRKLGDTSIEAEGAHLEPPFKR